MEAPLSHRRHNSIIVDLRDVVFTLSADMQVLEAFRKIFRSTAWTDFENGKITENECRSLLSSSLSLSSSSIASTIHTLRMSLRLNTPLLNLLRGLKDHNRFRIFAMSNISNTDWEALHRQVTPDTWTLFDHVFTSASFGEGKPALSFYRHVLEVTGIDPGRTIFIDNKVDHVVSAMSFGMTGVLFGTTEEASRQLDILLRDPVEDANRWLRSHAKAMWSVTDTGILVEENFAQLLLLEITEDESLVDVIRYPKHTNFFRGEDAVRTATFPDDLDTTSIACTVLKDMAEDVKLAIMDEILGLKTRDGIVTVYFDRTRPRFDPVVCVNVLTMFSKSNRETELSETLDWVYEVLQNRAYEHGTRYYFGGDPFLYFLTRLLSASQLARERFSGLFSLRVQERIGLSGDSLALGMRIVAAASIGIRDTQDYRRLLEMQEDDGSWPVGWLYGYPSNGIQIGNKGLTTAIAVSAIKKYQNVSGF